MKFSTIYLTISFCLNFINCRSQQPITDERAMVELQHFYISYIKEASQIGTKHYRRVDSLLRRYGTAKLITQLKEEDEADYDFFLNTNGPQIESANTVQVFKDNKEKDIYVVSFVYYHEPFEKDEIIRIKLRLIKTSTGILIDRIVR